MSSKGTLQTKAPTNGRGKLGQELARDWQLYVLVAVPIVFLLIFSYWPMYGIFIAFQKFSPVKGVFGSTWVGWDNFARFFSTPSATRTITNTLAISLLSLLANLPMPILLAILLNECRSTRFRKSVQMVTYAPYFISTVVMVSMLLLFLDPRTGVFNRMIAALGGQTVDFMADKGMFRGIYVISGVWQGTGFGAVIYIAALAGIDPSLYEAARIDGAGRLQKIWHIDLPGILPTIIIMFILSCGSIMNVGFEKAYLMQNAANQSVSEVLSTYTYKVGLINLDYGYSSAVGMFNSVINTIFIVLANTICGRLSETTLW